MSPRRLLVEELHQLQKLLVEPLAENEEDGVVLDGISWGSLDEEERPHPSTHMKTCSSKEDTAIFPPIFSPIFLTKTRPKLQVIAIILVSFSKLLTAGARISSSKSDFHWPSWSKQTTFFFQHGCAWKVWICATFWELTSGFLPRNTKVMGPLLKIFGYTSLQKQTWLDGKSPFWIGATSSNVFFSIVMLVFGGCTVRWEMEHGSLQDGFRFKK